MDEPDEDLNLFTRAPAIAINSWMCVKHIPFSTVNVIVAEVFNSYQKGVDTTKKNVQKALTEIGLRRKIGKTSCLAFSKMLSL